MSVQPIPAVLLGERPLSLKEEMQRIQAKTYIDRTDKANLCAVEIHVGIFFDGTNNNKQRDQEDVLVPKDRNGKVISGAKPGDPSACSHSNVVVLFDAFADKVEDGFYRFYAPGVGTAFKDLHEESESADGKAKATGGDARINWAMIQLLNAMHRSITKAPLVSDAQIGGVATSAPLHKLVSANMDGKRTYFTGDRSDGLGGVLGDLKSALASRPPKKLVQVNVSVFGFSRGAAQARAFCHFVHHILLKEQGGAYTLAGVPFRIQFLGLFDSVASVGLADASPFWRGLGGWAQGTQDIVPSVERTVHLCAAHETRINFPLSTGRIGSSYPANCIERVYPGAHSNIGGGYPAGSQGKSVGARSKLLSQMPLLEMYREARLSAVPLLSVDDLQKIARGDQIANDLKVDPSAVQLFEAYRAYSAGIGGTVEEALHGHTKLYWRWRLQYLNKVETLPSFQRAGAQDRVDMRESAGDFDSDIATAIDAAQTNSTFSQREPLSASLGIAPVQRDFLEVLREASKVPALVDRFFDEMVHDSHASFYMAGPVTDYDRQQKINQIQAKVDVNRRYEDWLKSSSAAVARQSGAPSQPLPPVRARDLPESLSRLEQRIFDYQKMHPGQYPVVDDSDRDQLLAMEDLTTSGGVRLVTNKTRRELGGPVRYRRVFDRS